MTAPRSKPAAKDDSAFVVHSALDLLGGWVERHRGFWLALGRLESALLAHELRAVPLTMPIYVCGLARSGSTLLHEILSAHPRVATHRVKDYPLAFIPWWWRRATAHLRPTSPRERAHQDGVLLSPDSPDALEEMLWMAFFPTCHDVRVSNRMEAEDSHPAFEAFYRAHLGKVLLAERAERYVAKANYHIARLPYLLRLFPDAQVILPVRSPQTHIASLLRQHRRFSDGQRRHPRALAFMRRSGHFEFGLDRRPMNLGDNQRVRAVLDAWAKGEEVRGWARCWDMTYAHLAGVLATDASVRAAALVVRFEAMCDAPAETIRSVLAHCRLPDGELLIERFTGTIRVPDYYQSGLTPEDLAVIHEETAGTARQWGY